MILLIHACAARAYLPIQPCDMHACIQWRYECLSDVRSGVRACGQTVLWCYRMCLCVISGERLSGQVFGIPIPLLLRCGKFAWY